MDDIFGEIFYIIILLVIFIFSAFKKKKPQEDDMSVPGGEAENPMDEVFSPFKDVFGDEDEEEEEKEEAKKSREAAGTPVKGSSGRGRKNLEGAPFVKEDYVFTSETSPGDKRRQRKNQAPGRQTSLRSEQDQPEEHWSDRGVEWFDLKQAVIFSEILKRPDY